MKLLVFLHGRYSLYRLIFFWALSQREYFKHLFTCEEQNKLGSERDIEYLAMPVMENTKE